ncbi:MAG: AAA family ATPase [Faecalibacterium sp.]
MDVSKFQLYQKKIVSSCSKVIVGKAEAITLLAACFLCSGNVLLEDVPGTGKTMLLRAFSQSIGGNFKRVQFTPDLLPSDLTGINFYHPKTGEFTFRPGPVFANIVLADEINRATPRTQSSLLEAMEEHQVTVDGLTYPLAEPFMVMATQNPIESYGTFPLPEAQLDRFMMKLTLGYMTPAQELQVIVRPSTAALLTEVDAVVLPEEIASLKQAYHNISVSPAVAEYIMAMITATRTQGTGHSGVSTRGAIALYQLSQVMAAFAGRDYVIPEDVKALVFPVLGHRIMANSSDGMNAAKRHLEQLLEKIPVPMERI